MEHAGVARHKPPWEPMGHAMDGHWQIKLLESLQAQSGERIITRFQTHKTAALLAYLAYYLHRSHPRDTLTEFLWPESPPQAARASLSMALSSLRHQLEPPGVPAGAVIVADRSSVRLNPDAVHTDVAEFGTALQAVERAGSQTERAHWLAQAVERYRGELLPGYFEEWVLQEREYLAERYFQTLGQLLVHLEQGRDLNRALAYARQGVRADPLREEVHRELIRLYLAAGQPEAAVRQYQELERLLKEQLEATPTAATRALLREIEHGAELAPLAVPRGAPPRSGGLCRVPRSDDAGRPAISAHGTRHTAHGTPPSGGLPAGTVTFLLTDIEGSTSRWERASEVFPAALARHHTLLRQVFAGHEGHEVKELGDGFLVAFARAGDALACAVAGQRAVAAASWPAEVGALRVRMALDTGDVQPEEGDYHGAVLHRASRVLVAGHGGQILCSEATAALLRRDLEPGVQLRELGAYRLRDVAAPERLFQVEYSGMEPRQFPPLNAEAGYASNLPLQFTRFFGREEEIELLSKLLVAPERRLVTLMGPGGSGKTRLALEVASRLIEEWRGAVWFVPLADLPPTPPDGGAGTRHQLSDTVRDALLQPRAPNVEPLEQVVEALCRQPSLLVLDNFEQLVDAGAEWVQILLERAPHVTLLVTSRQRLNLAGEREFTVLPLPTPDAGDPVEQVARSESVQLFVDRAQAVRPDFQVTPGNASIVAALCQRLEGIPLAIELAAARAQVLTPAQMLTRVEQRLDLLTSRQRGVAARHRSLRAMLDWSYELLSPELRQFLARLSVFRGGWSLEAAEAICEEPLALDYLQQLRECSLILMEELGEAGWGPRTVPAGTEGAQWGPGPGRYRLLETIREYGQEKLQTLDEAVDLRGRHRDWCLELAEQAAPELTGPDQRQWLDQLEREHDNLRAALGWSTERGEVAGTHEVGRGLRLGKALCQFWIRRGDPLEGRKHLAGLLALEGAETLPALRAKALWAAGTLARQQGDYEAAQKLCEESLAIHQELGDRPGTALSLYALGTVARNQGDYEAARARFEESLAIERERGDSKGIANALNSLGVVAGCQGDYEAARTLLERGLAIYRQIEDKEGVARALDSLGNVANCQGDYGRARAHYEESLAIDLELDAKWSIARSLHNLGVMAQAQEDCGAARRLFEESLALQRKLGDKQGISSSLIHLGEVALIEGDSGAARTLFLEGLAIQREVGNRQLIAHALDGWAALATAQGQPVRAGQLFGAAEALREAIHAPREPAWRARYERNVAATRAALTEEAFKAAWAEGRAMTLEAAINAALE